MTDVITVPGAGSIQFIDNAGAPQSLVLLGITQNELYIRSDSLTTGVSPFAGLATPLVVFQDSATGGIFAPGYNTGANSLTFALGSTSYRWDVFARNADINGTVGIGTLSLTNPLPVASGGTGLATLATTNGVLYASSASSFSLSAAPSANGQFFGWNGANFAWLVPSTSGNVVTNPAATATNTIVAPTTAGVIPLTIKGNSTANTKVLSIYDSAATPVERTYFDANGNLILAAAGGTSSVFGVRLGNVASTVISASTAGGGALIYDSGVLKYADGTQWFTLSTAGAGISSIAIGTGILNNGGTSSITSSGTLSVDQYFAPIWNSAHIFNRGLVAYGPGSSDYAVRISSASVASANGAVLEIGSGPWSGTGGFTGDSTAGGGTQLGINAATGFVGNLIDAQKNGVSQFKLSNAGAATFVGAVTASSFSGSGSGLTANTIPTASLVNGTTGQIHVANASGVFTTASMSGDATIAASGAITLATVVVAKGGTGLATLGVANGLLYGSGTTAFAQTPAPVLNNFLSWNGSVYTWAAGTGSFTGGTLTSTLVLATGTTSAQPLKFQSGANLTTAVAGSMEWDGASLYYTPNSTTPVRLTVAYTTSSISGTASNVTGVVAVANGGTGLTSFANVIGVLYSSFTGAVAVVATPTTSGQYLGWNGTVLSWTTPPTGGAATSISMGATAATSGTAGSVLYVASGPVVQQTAIGSSGQFLISGGAAAPTWGAAVTSVSSGAGIVGGPITGTGTLSIDQTSAFTPSWLGAHIFNKALTVTTPGTTDYAVRISSASVASTNGAVLEIGSGLWSGAGGFTGDSTASGGTQLGINAVTGFAGNLIDAQKNGVSQFKLSNAGAATFVGTVTASSFSGSGSGLTANTIPTASLVNGTIGQILVANASGVFTTVSMSGDATIAASGAITLATVTVPKGGTGQTSFTTGQILYGNATGAVSTSSTLFFNSASGALTVGSGILTLGGNLSTTGGNVSVTAGGVALTLAGNLTTSGANAITFTTTGSTSVTLPTAGTLITTSPTATQVISGAKTTFAAAVAGYASINLPTSAATNPTTPISGDLWWNGSNLNFYNGSLTKDLLAASGGTVTSVTASTPISSSGGNTPNLILGTVLVANGGTGQTTFSVANGLVYASATTAFAQTPAPVLNNFLSWNGSVYTWAAGTGSFTGGTLTSTLVLATGTTSAQPLKFQSGANLTTAVAGSMEWDGTNLYYTPSGTTRQTVAYLTSSVANVTGIVALANGGTNTSLTATNGGIVYSTASAMGISAAGTSGYLLQSNGAAAPTWVAPSGGTSFTWQAITASATAVVNNGYITNSATVIAVLLPATSVVGALVEVAGQNTGGWQVTQAAGQQIFFGSATTTAGTGGSLASINQHDCVRIVCITANTTWLVVSSVGNINVT